MKISVQGDSSVVGGLPFCGVARLHPPGPWCAYGVKDRVPIGNPGPGTYRDGPEGLVSRQRGGRHRRVTGVRVGDVGPAGEDRTWRHVLEGLVY